MSVVVVIGAQWGDEGKGKVVDLYTQHADVVVRYGGGANAGHTLVVGGKKLVLHLVPSGALHGSKRCVLAQGTVIDPAVLLEEIAELGKRGLATGQTLVVSDRAHVVLPQHKVVDALREQGAASIGTTKRGIGPCYEDKAARRGVRIGDLLDPERFRRKLAANLEAWRPVVASLGGAMPAAEEIAVAYLKFGAALRPYVGDASRVVSEALARGEQLLCEGAQGTMLDVDHGTYPYVTSSSTTAGGACTGAGIGPTNVSSVVGITKAYATRVGGGPFPTELHDAIGARLREAGAEFGATTGRPRRCGWLDLPALRYAVRINGLSGLAVTKLDVLTGLPELSVCVGYELDGARLDEPPYDDVDLARVRPVYETFAGWTDSLAGCRTLGSLPDNARRYVTSIEKLAGCPVWLVSVGADREQTIMLHNPFGGV